ncbi:MAG: GspJ family type II secretion system protein [Nitrospirota bacterium]|nr:GspJ family type II secretion system protein [Nitrospirota bacterium]
MRNRPEDRGFTLIEVLISLALLSVVLGALYSSFFTVQRALQRFDSVSLKYQEARTALDIMRREIESSFLKTGEKAKDMTLFEIRDRDVFGKSTSSISLTSFSFKGYNTNAVSYFVRENNGRLDLFRTEAPAGIKDKGYTLEVMENIEGFTVETLFNNKWVRTWNTAETEKLPELVRVSIEFEDNRKTVTLTEYARPMTGKQL